MLRLIWWLLWPVDALGRQAARAREWAYRRYHLARALKPGTPVALQCACHQGVVWYVEQYNADAGDYKVVSTWPAPELAERHFETTVMYIMRDKLKPVLEAQ